MYVTLRRSNLSFLFLVRDRYGFGENMAEDSYDESSSGSDEDEIGEELTPAVDVQILKTIAAIRRKDERIYEPKADFFSG